MGTADVVLDTFIAIGILLMVVSAITRKIPKHIPSQELNSADVAHTFRRIQRP